MSELTREQIEAMQAGGPGWCSSKSFDTLCNMALRSALFEQLGRDGVWDSARDLLRELGRNNPEESDRRTNRRKRLT